MTKQRKSYYEGSSADFSKPGLISPEKSHQLLAEAQRLIGLREKQLPPISDAYSANRIENENRDWWPTHCAALRAGRADLLAGEYVDELVYLCADGPFYGRDAGTAREANWWAIISQPGVTMVWPIVMFHGDVVYFEWNCLDDVTGETIAKGNVSWHRRGHRGGCYLKCEQLTFFRDVFAQPDLLKPVPH